jgi:hypothetical protein
MMKTLYIIFILLLAACGSQPSRDSADINLLMENGYLAREGFNRSLNFVYAWLEHADPETGLIPRNLTDSKDYWNAKDSAADNYPFMVLTAAILDQELYRGTMTDILETEIALTSRLGRLPDTFYFSLGGFNDEMDKDDIIFGASEYAKDGLLALTEYIGDSPWSERMIGLLDDIWKYAEYETEFGNIPSLNVEVNGELLQVLSRIYWMTEDEKYLEWAFRLGDYYLLGDNSPTDTFDILRLRDHGCEIVSGLVELYITTAFTDNGKQEAYKPEIYKMLDRILEIGINEHGLFYNQVNPKTGEILDDGIADTWGYTYNAYYAVWMLDGHEPYRDALIKAMNNLHHYENFDWERGSADGYADSIESALNLYNRERLPDTANWIDSQIQIMWAMQDSAHRTGTEAYRGTGIIEGWHGDGNFARTTLMYCLWKTQGVTLHPWNSGIIYGAEPRNNGIALSIQSSEEWAGKIMFDSPRHKNIFNLPLDYPRINQFPEWFVIDSGKDYRIVVPQYGINGVYPGSQLLKGFPLQINRGQQLLLEIYLSS